jgi:serine/threonine protein kinase
MATLVGTHLDRYEIDAELGRGAMGVVYRARDLKLDRTVAIKMISLFGLEPDAEQEYRKRFLVEARAAGRLSHAGIVTVFDVREDAETGTPYLVMEYIQGQSLQQLVSRENRTLPLSTTLRLIQEVAEALHYAHTQGVVHRDIKPANILVTPDGHPKIADFGIAKLNQNDVTLPGQVLGSPAFMAPEQLNDEGVDARSDLFSLGVILYYMLTGHRPFQGNSTATVCFKLVNHDPLPVSAFESKFTPELDNIVSRAIAKDPAQRYQTGMAMASDIQRLIESSGFANGDGKVDWTMRSLKRDAIPRYVSGCAEPRPTKHEVASQGPEPTLRVTTDSGGAIEHSKAVQTRGARFSWKSLLVSGLLTLVMGFGAFWGLHRTKPELGAPINKDPRVQQSTTSIGNDSRGNNEQTTAKQQKPRRSPISKRMKVSRSWATASGAKVQLPPANIPVPAVLANATLQIEIEHHFTNALASVWVDKVLVYTQSLQGDKTRRALLFRKVVGHQFEAIRVPMGKHEVRVRIQSATDSYDQSKTMADALVRNESTLRIICGNKRSELKLTLQ